MAAKSTNFVCKVTPEQSAALRDLLEGRGWAFSSVPYAEYRAVGEKVNATCYTSGKLVVQGGGTADFVQFILEPEVLHTYTFGYEAELAVEAAEAAPPVDPHGGIDESGKGDFFGPLVIAGVCVDAASAVKLSALGVCDSKLISGSRRIVSLAAGIRAAAPDCWSVVVLMPETYNRLYASFGNLNRLLAWGHARTIENLLEKVPDCPRMLSDQFAHESLIKRALMERGRKIQLDQHVRAESDVAVAAASILAREGFLNGMKKLADQFGCELPRGAGSRVGEVGRELLVRHGAEVFNRCAKTHFKTYAELTGAVL